MPPARAFPALVSTLLCAALLPAAPAEAGRRRASHEARGHQTFTSPQSNPIALSPDGSRLFVASTTSHRVDVIDAAGNLPVGSVEVGLEPVGLAVRPGGSELWVTNHVSDSVSVIDIVPGSPRYLQVVQTVQDLDGSGVTQFDEPVGVAFREDGSRAYVALSSRNDVAVIDTASYAVTARLHIRAQDPRALAVRGGYLYVAAFESSNQTEISACELLSDDPRPGQCTLAGDELADFALSSPNLPDSVKNIVVDDDLPDRDLFVFDLATDPPTELAPVEGVGTLLYGVAVDAAGRVFVSQADARNAENGDHDDVLASLDNRMFDNRIARVDCGGGSCAAPTQLELDPPVGTAPAPGTALATPYGIALSADGGTLVVTAAASSRIASISATSGAVLDRLDVGAIPRGIALRHDGGDAHTVYVLNTLGNSVSVVTLDAASGALALAVPAVAPLQPIPVGDDPTPDAVRRGRIVFNDANASDEGSFACASCHPDGHTDQLVWRIGGACPAIGCGPGDEPRTTMPVRGLRDTLPLHWDGTLGDPFGGGNGAVGSGGNGGTQCSTNDPHGCFLDLVDASLAGVMCDQSGSCPPGGTRLTAQQIDDMATFLENVSYPPARSRRLDDGLSATAVAGFEQFYMDQGDFIPVFPIPEPDTCADSSAGCHELPLGTGTNSETLGGFDVPTMRGMTDRFLQFSLGVNTEEVLAGADDGLTADFPGAPFPITGVANLFPWNGGANGYEEDTSLGVAFSIFTLIYKAFVTDVFQMLEEASTGHSGALGRQVTLNTASAAGCPACELETVLDALETADLRGVVNLRGRGLRNGSGRALSYLAESDEYRVGQAKLTRAQIVAEAQAGTLLATLTAHQRSGVSDATPQPLVSVRGANCGTGTGATGDPKLPVLSGSGTTMDLETKYVTTSDRVFVDGENWTQLHGASLSPLGGQPLCGSESVTPDKMRVDLAAVPTTGTHFLQIQSDGGLLSNELPFVRQ